MRKVKVGAAALMLGLLALAAGVSAQAAEQQGEMSAEQKAQMEAWMKAMTPGAEHQRLAQGVGTWNATVTMWEAPGAPPQTSQAVAKRRMALGGRVLVEEWTGMMMGMPFEGLGTSGYDNVAKRYWGTWNDNMSTGIMTTTGSCDPDPAKGCTFVGEMVNMMTGKDDTVRETVTWANPDEERFQMFGKGPDGKEYRMMEIVAKRAK